jgi:hypothetical protein
MPDAIELALAFKDDPRSYVRRAFEKLSVKNSLKKVIELNPIFQEKI